MIARNMTDLRTLLNWNENNRHSARWTVLLRKLAHKAFHFQIILLSSSGHSIYNSDELILLEFINFNRNGSPLPREAFSKSKAKTLKLYAMNRREET